MKSYALLVHTDSSNQALLRIAGVLNRFRVKVRSLMAAGDTGNSSHAHMTVIFDGDSRVAERILQQTRRFVEVWDAHVHEHLTSVHHEQKALNRWD